MQVVGGDSECGAHDGIALVPVSTETLTRTGPQLGG